MRITAVVGFLALVSCSSPEVKEGTPGESALPDGEKLFVQNCASCHGCDGTLGMSGAHDLSDSKMTFNEVKFTIEKGTDNGMPRFKEILSNEAELDAVVEFVLTLKKAKKEN